MKAPSFSIWALYVVPWLSQLALLDHQVQSLVPRAGAHDKDSTWLLYNRDWRIIFSSSSLFFFFLPLVCIPWVVSASYNCVQVSWVTLETWWISEAEQPQGSHPLLLTQCPGRPAILSVQDEHMGPSRSFSNQNQEIPSSRTTPFVVDEQGICTSRPSPNSSPLQGLLERDHQGSPTTFHSGSCLN